MDDIETKYFCYNCKGIYTRAQVTFNDRWVSKYCPDCFHLGESPNDCILDIMENNCYEKL